MFKVFSAKTANDVWLKIASEIMANETGTQGSRLGGTSEFLHTAISIEDPSQRWVVGRNPPLNPAFAIAEVIWIIQGRRDARFLTYFFRDLPKFIGNARYPHGAYGHRLRSHLGVDQLNRAYSALKNNKDTRQVVLQIWDSKIDLPKQTGQPSSPDIPCNIVSLLKVRDGRLEWLQVMRSNDVFRGLPHNFVQFTSLQEIFAGWLDIEMGSYQHMSDSLHVYKTDSEGMDKFENLKSKKNTDSLALPKKESTAAFKELENAIMQIISKRNFSAKQCEALVSKSRLPNAYINMLRVLVAEGLRRRGLSEQCHSIMSDCSNPVYLQLFDRWMKRVGAPDPA